MPRAATQHFILTLHNIEDNQAQLDEWLSWENKAVRYISGLNMFNMSTCHFLIGYPSKVEFC
jgi:hypothetical protein